MISRSERLPWRLFSAWVALLCLVAAAAPLREGEFYRPLPPEASGRVGTSAAFRRSPCPALNALANHGFISRDGKAITARALKAAVMAHFNVDSRYADTLVALAKKPVFDLDELSAHNVVEHDMSMVHKDACFGQDPAVTDAALIDDFVGHVGAAGVLDPWFFARTQQRRLRECMAHNPQCEFSNEFLLSVTLGRQGLLMRVMGGRNDEAVDLETAKMLLVDEQLAPNWARSSTPISQSDIQDSRVRLFALLKASGEWLGDGFGTTHQPLVNDAYATQCLQISNKTLVVATCDNASDAQQFLLDGQQRLTTTGSGCIQVAKASNASGASIVESACSTDPTPSQQWRYDASGRLRPVHAPNLCLDLVAVQDQPTRPGQPRSVLTANCSTRNEQRFYSFYSNFQPSVSRLASVATPRFCLGLEIGATTSSALDLSPVVVTPCDSMDDAQELTLDERKRLVFTYDPTQCVDLGDSSAIVQKPCSDSSATWRYDSLSRLHPSANASKCIEFPDDTDSNSGRSITNVQRKVRLVDCADGLAQKWFISDTKNADFRPADQFYRPNVFESSGRPGTSAAYSRSPCPALNALANHGLLPRSGRNLTAQQVKKAVVDHFNIDQAYAQVLVALANRSVFNLDDLSVHNAAEHDMSLVHADAFFGQDPAVTDPTLAAELFRHVGSSDAMDVLFFARTQARRLKQCQARNPQCDFSNEFLMSVALGRLGLLMRAMGGKNQDLVDVARVRSFLIDEKIPADFIKSPTPITQANIQETRIHVYALLKSSGGWLVDGFLNSQTGVAVVSEGGGHTLCLEIADGSMDAGAALVVANCDATKNEQKWLLDDNQRLVNAKSGLCVTAVDYGTRDGTVVVQLECSEDEASNQLWTYDSSGRLRPAHAATMCLDVDSTSTNETSTVKPGSAVTLADCDATSQQRFYSIYESFQPNVSHLTSIDRPELCMSVAAASTADGAAVEVASCDPLLDEQQFTMDAGGRLVFKHSDKCLATTGGPEQITQATCADNVRQLWLYDSLGRLHAVANPSQCIALTNQSSPSLVLTDCNGAGVQRWFAPDAKDPNSRPQNAYYRPNRDESSGMLGTMATYSRSPCPALNALANHGLISRDGRNISRSDLVGAAVATFNIEPALAEAFLVGVPDDFLNLDQLSSPGVFEYTGSLVHSDAYFSPDPAAIDSELVRDLFARVGSDNAVDLVFFAAAQRRRLDAYAHRGGQPNAALSTSKYLKPGLVLRAVGGQNAENASVDLAKLLLVEERIPDAFQKSTTAVSLNDAMDSGAKVQAMVETGGTSASGVGGTSVAWLSQPFHPKRAPIFAARGANGSVLCLTLANGVATLENCNATQPAQLFTYDEQQRLVVDATASCLDVVDGKLGSGVAVSHVECTDWPHQKWTYDVSGRLHPQHAPKFCLSVGSKANATGALAKCSNASEQFFFTTFPALALRGQQLVSTASFGPGTRSPGFGQQQLTHCLSARRDTLGVGQCDQDEASRQLFSLDDAQTLITAPGATSQCVATSDGVVELGDCPSQATWTHDSLGRVHAQSARGRCLATGETASDPVRVESCSLAASQRWLVATLTARTPNVSSGERGPSSESTATRRPRSSVAVVSLVIHVAVVMTAQLQL